MPLDEESAIAIGWHEGIGDALDAIEAISETATAPGLVALADIEACLRAMRAARGTLGSIKILRDLVKAIDVLYANSHDCGGHIEVCVSTVDWARLQSAQAVAEQLLDRRPAVRAEVPRRPRKVHDVKSVSPYYEDVVRGGKSFDVRQNDRDYAVGDALVMRHWNKERYTGRYTHALITYMIEGPPYLPDGLAVLGIEPFPAEIEIAHALLEGVPMIFERILR